MNQKQEAFLQEYLRTGDKIAAYQLAYPNAKQSSLKNSANRLLQNHPEIIEAVNAKRGAWQQEVEAEVEAEAKAGMKFKYLTKLRAKQILTLTAEGVLETDKVWRTRDGFETHPVTPSHAQILSAIHKYAMMEGWYAPKSRVAKGESDKKKKEEEDEGEIKIFMNKIPFDEYGSLYSATLEAYFGPDAPRWRCQPDNNHTHDRFLAWQQKREGLKDEERAARMTPQLKLEEEQAIREFQSRPADETGYHHHDKIIVDLLNDHAKEPDPKKVEALTALQKMCGLRFLHHRHRYEAEREAGWQFHPFNHVLIKPVNPKHNYCHSDPACAGEESAGPKHAAEERSSMDSHLPFRGGREGLNQPQTRQQPTTIQPEPPTKPKATPLEILQQGYKPINELWQDEFDYYIKNQGSTTYRQKKDLERFSAHRKAPPEIRQQIEQETGWLYHPDDTNYAKRNPNRPLVRTKFPGPLRNV